MSTINKTELEANWSLISSDPDVFNDMLRAYDINEVVMQEAYSVTFDGLINESPVYGVIYTSRYDPDERLPDNIEEDEPGSENIVFTSQIVTNACATLALLSILLNANIDKGEILRDFASFTDKFTSINRGIALGNSPQIRKIHNSYAIGETLANEAILADESLTENDVIEEDNFHFVSYIPKDGFIWELDGLKSRPIKLAAIKEGEHWLEILGPILIQKMSVDDQCNILVAIKNPLIEMKKSLSRYTNELESLKTDESGSGVENMDEGRKSQKRKRDYEEDDDYVQEEKKDDDEKAPPRKRQERTPSPDKVEEKSQIQINQFDKRKGKEEASSHKQQEQISSSDKVEEISKHQINHMEKEKENEEGPSQQRQEKMASSDKAKEKLKSQINQLEKEIDNHEKQIEIDKMKMMRQKFDYFPFISQLISKVHQYQKIHPPVPLPAPTKEEKGYKNPKKNTKASKESKSSKATTKIAKTTKTPITKTTKTPATKTPKKSKTSTKKNTTKNAKK